MNQPMRTHCRRQPLAALAALLVLALAARPILADGPGLTGYVNALGEKGKITGIVPGAAIEFKGAAVVKATADKDGRYKVDLRPGTYTYKLSGDGFKAEDEGRAITTTASDGYQVKSFGLSKDKTDPKEKPTKTDPKRKPPDVPDIAAGILQGEVVEKKADGKEVPIPGATVYLRNQKGKSPLSQVTTRMQEDKTKQGQKQGHFELELPAGTYTASVVAGGFEPFKQAEPITIVAHKTASRRFVLTRATPPPPPTDQGIEGTVKYADPGKEALPPVKVSIVSAGGSDKPLATFSPDAKDGFQRNLPEGSYRLVVEAKGYRTYPRTIPDVYVLKGSYSKVNVYLVPDLLFVAEVYERVGHGTRPLYGANVELVNSAEPASQAVQLTTDKRGYASVTLAKEGNYAAGARLTGFKAAKGVKVKVSATGENRALIEMEPDAPPPSNSFDLTIVAKTKSKTPVSGADVTVTLDGKKLGSGALPPGRTDSSGSYTAKGLGAGSYTVQVSKEGFKAASSPLTVNLTKNDSREIVLTADATPPKPVDPPIVIKPSNLVDQPKDTLVTVPNVRGSSESEAKSLLTAVRLKEEFVGNPNLGPARFQNYRAGAHVRPGTVVVVYFPEPEKPQAPKEPALVIVPNVTGDSESVVKSKLVDAGLREEFTGNPHLGPSRFQNYRAGAHVKPGTVVVVHFPEAEKPAPPKDTLVIVPNVTGDSYAVARRKLAEAELKEEYTGNPNLGPAQSQNYRAGAHVKPGTVVIVHFPDKDTSPTETLVTVPNVTGSSYADVKSKLAEAKLKEEYTGNPKLGPARFQNYHPGAHVRPGTVIVVYFPEAEKPAPPTDTLVTVPNVTGSSYADVREKLAAVNLKEEYTGNPKLGPARSQNYRAGAHVKPGTVVVVYFPETEKRPDAPAPARDTLVTVPNVTGSSYADVREKLAAVGLKEEHNGNPSLGPARFQNYRAGAQVKAGTIVEVYFPEAAKRQERPAPVQDTLVTVPNVTGSAYAVVRRDLAAARLREEYSGNPNLGPARSQKPAAGERVKPGTPIYVYFPEQGQR